MQQLLLLPGYHHCVGVWEVWREGQQLQARWLVVVVGAVVSVQFSQSGCAQAGRTANWLTDTVVE